MRLRSLVFRVGGGQRRQEERGRGGEGEGERVREEGGEREEGEGSDMEGETREG